MSNSRDSSKPSEAHGDAPLPHMSPIFSGELRAATIRRSTQSEPFIARPSSGNGDWSWYPHHIRSYIVDEKVPPVVLSYPYSVDKKVYGTLPPHGYPMEEAFAGFVAATEREFQSMREAITNLIANNNSLQQELDQVKQELAQVKATQQTQAVRTSNLRQTSWVMADQIIDLTERMGLAEHRIIEAELANAPEAGVPEEIPEQAAAANEDELMGDGDVEN